MKKKIKAPRNKTIDLTDKEIDKYSSSLIKINKNCLPDDILNSVIQQDFFDVIEFLPDNFVDLLFVDPPYNLNKNFNNVKFNKTSIEKYTDWVDKVISKLASKLKKDASIYFCGDWNSSTSIHLVLSKYFKVRNRITWEREKGRGSKRNWKNNFEDIWFSTVSDDYTFNIDDVKLKRKVIAPYRNANGQPKDWQEENNEGFRLTYPSNIWTDISIPFWSMPENTNHPTQKPEKLLAKIILASSNKGDVIFDPFAGSGTTLVVSKKLKRNFVGIELDKYFACVAQKRLELAQIDDSIQGYRDGVFWERNTFLKKKNSDYIELFDPLK